MDRTLINMNLYGLENTDFNVIYKLAQVVLKNSIFDIEVTAMDSKLIMLSEVEANFDYILCFAKTMKFACDKYISTHNIDMSKINWELNGWIENKDTDAVTNFKINHIDREMKVFKTNAQTTFSENLDFIPIFVDFNTIENLGRIEVNF